MSQVGSRIEDVCEDRAGMRRSMSDKIFQIDNPFFTFMGRCADYVILNLLFVITSLPVLTIGASLRAMHESLLLMREGREGVLCKTYCTQWLLHFAEGTKLWLTLLIPAAVLVVDLYIVFSAKGGALQPALLAGLTAMMTLWIMVFSWCFVMPERTQEKVSGRIRRALLCAMRFFPATLCMATVEILPVAVCVISFQTFAAVVEPMYMIFGFSLSAEICNRLAQRAFDQSQAARIKVQE